MTKEYDEDDTHDKLVLAYLEYFKQDALYDKRRSFRTRKAARQALRDIRRLAADRMVEIQKDYQVQVKRKREEKAAKKGKKEE